MTVGKCGDFSSITSIFTSTVFLFLLGCFCIVLESKSLPLKFRIADIYILQAVNERLATKFCAYLISVLNIKSHRERATLSYQSAASVRIPPRRRRARTPQSRLHQMNPRIPPIIASASFACECRAPVGADVSLNPRPLARRHHNPMHLCRLEMPVVLA